MKNQARKLRKQITASHGLLAEPDEGKVYGAEKKHGLKEEDGMVSGSKAVKENKFTIRETKSFVFIG